MNMKRAAAFAALFLAFSAHGENVWRNITPESRITGRMVSPGYLKGKVVLLDCRDYAEKTKENVEGIRYLQSVWTSYKTKPFILLGSHAGRAKSAFAARFAERAGATYPVYREAEVSAAEEGAMTPEKSVTSGRVYVFDSTLRKRLYAGTNLREAAGVVANAIMAATTPIAPAQYEYLLDWEIDNLPGQALNRLKEFRKKFPAEARKYSEAWTRLSKNDEVVKLSKLVSLVDDIKDRDPNSKNAKKLSAAIVGDLMEKYSALKDSKDANVVQEAKNALAELKWVQATLKQEHQNK